MKSRVLVILCMTIVLAACQKSTKDITPVKQQNYAAQTPQQNQEQNSGKYVNMTLDNNSEAARFSNAMDWNSYIDYSTSEGSKFISPIVANAMIASYLYSIHCDNNQDDLRSFSVDADMLRAYLADPEVTNVKLMFAHTASYIKSGKIGQHAGYNSGALTIVIAGYNKAGDYIYHEGKVLDHMQPCPHICAPGKAGTSFLY